MLNDGLLKSEPGRVIIVLWKMNAALLEGPNHVKTGKVARHQMVRNQRSGKENAQHHKRQARGCTHNVFQRKWGEMCPPHSRQHTALLFGERSVRGQGECVALNVFECVEKQRRKIVGLTGFELRI